MAPTSRGLTQGIMNLMQNRTVVGIGTTRCGVAWRVATTCSLVCLLVGTLSAQDSRARIFTCLDASGGEVKVRAEQAAFSTSIVIENTTQKQVAAALRVTPFRDATGHLHHARAFVGDRFVGSRPSVASGPSSDPSIASLPVEFPPSGALQVRVESTLVAEGEYSNHVVLAIDQLRDSVRLVVTRAPSDLGVEILGLDGVSGTSRACSTSTVDIRFVLCDKTGRTFDLNPLVLTKLTRKGRDGARTSALHQLIIGGHAPKRIQLSPNEPKEVALTLGGLDGAGEYAGTLRVSAPGAKPVDHDFTVTLRDSGGIALIAIGFGVGVAALLRRLSETIRPRLVVIRRVQLLVRELDEGLADRARHEAENEVLRVLRRQAIDVQITVEAGEMTGAKERVDGLERRQSLAIEWIARRRQVEALSPENLRDQFRPDIERVRDVVLNAKATEQDVEGSRKALGELNAKIDAALKKELVDRIAQLRRNLDSLKARQSAQPIISVQTVLGQIVNDAERAANENNLRHALALYSRAQILWTSFLLEDLAAVVDGPAPFGLAEADWRRLSERLGSVLLEARGHLPANPDAAIQKYNAARADYVAVLSEGLRKKLENIPKEAKKHDLSQEERDAMMKALQESTLAKDAAMTAIAEGRTQEAIGSLTRAVDCAKSAERSATPKNRAFDAAATMATTFPDIGAVAALVDSRGRDFVRSERTWTATKRSIDRIDGLVSLVALVVASLLGVTVLWSPNPTWGGWDDYIIAVLWGLGFHQFTYTGLSAVTDRLRGPLAAGGQR
jgi:hypothetical protein